MLTKSFGKINRHGNLLIAIGINNAGLTVHLAFIRQEDERSSHKIAHSTVYLHLSKL